MTLYLTEATDPADVAAAAADGPRLGGQALPGRRHHQLRQRRPRRCDAGDAGARAHGRDRPAALRPRRGHRRRRSTSSTARPSSSTASSRRSAAACPSSASCWSTSPPPTASHFVRDRRASIAGDDHRPPPDPQPERLLVGGVRPHFYCLPIVKRETPPPRAPRAPRPAATRASSSAPTAPRTPLHAKEAACGCAGVFTAPVALAWLAQVFEEEGALDRLEGFASLNGPAFYRLPPTRRRLTLERGPSPLRRSPRRVETGAGAGRGLRAGLRRCTGGSPTQEEPRCSPPAFPPTRRWRG